MLLSSDRMEAARVEKRLAEILDAETAQELSDFFRIEIHSSRHRPSISGVPLFEILDRVAATLQMQRSAE